MHLAPVVQLVEHSTENGNAVSSSLTWGNHHYHLDFLTGCRSVGRSLALGVRGHWFDPNLPEP
jgi:hypothetical protein